jgi:predicted transcriptional regulator
MSIIKLFEPLREVKVVEPNFDTYTVINMNPYTLEEQLIMYPIVVVHQTAGCPNTVIDIE